MTTLQQILLGELNPLWFSEFDAIIVNKINGEFSLKSKATFAVKSSHVTLGFSYSQGEYFCDISKAFEDRENYLHPEGMNLPTKDQLNLLSQEWAENYIDRINYPELW